MEFRFEYLFEFLEDISTQTTFLFERFMGITTPYFLPILDFGIRTYIWIQDLPVFQLKKNAYAEILASDTWYYTGFLVHVPPAIPFYSEYKMIHHYDTERNPGVETYPPASKIDTLIIVKKEKTCRCHRNTFVFSATERSNVRFLYIEFIHKGITVSLDIPDEMMQIGNELFTPAFIYRLLDHTSASFSFLFDLDYHLVIVDEYLNSSNLDSGKYVVLEKDTYRVECL